MRTLFTQCKWRVDHQKHDHSKELDGGLYIACFLFDKFSTTLGVFLKNTNEDISKPEKTKDHTELQYHLAAIIKAERLT